MIKNKDIFIDNKSVNYWINQSKITTKRLVGIIYPYSVEQEYPYNIRYKQRNRVLDYQNNTFKYPTISKKIKFNDESKWNNYLLKYSNSYEFKYKIFDNNLYLEYRYKDDILLHIYDNIYNISSEIRKIKSHILRNKNEENVYKTELTEKLDLLIKEIELFNNYAKKLETFRTEFLDHLN